MHADNYLDIPRLSSFGPDPKKILSRCTPLHQTTLRKFTFVKYLERLIFPLYNIAHPSHNGSACLRLSYLYLQRGDCRGCCAEKVNYGGWKESSREDESYGGWKESSREEEEISYGRW